MNKYRFGLMIIVGFIFSGCSSYIQINTYPQGALISHDNQIIGTSPFKYEIDISDKCTNIDIEAKWFSGAIANKNVNICKSGESITIKRQGFKNFYLDFEREIEVLKLKKDGSNEDIAEIKSNNSNNNYINKASSGISKIFSKFFYYYQIATNNR